MAVKQNVNIFKQNGKMRREFYEVLDRVLNEFEERFSVQLPVLEATRCLNPKSKILWTQIYFL